MKANANNDHKSGIFISYARADQKHAEAIAKKLSDWTDKESVFGSDWSVEIQEVLRETSVVLLITSKDSLASQYVNYEIGSAIAANTPIIPVLVDDIDSLPTYLRRTSMIDARGLDEESMGTEVSTAIREFQQSMG